MMFVSESRVVKSQGCAESRLHGKHGHKSQCCLRHPNVYNSLDRAAEAQASLAETPIALPPVPYRRTERPMPEYRIYLNPRSHSGPSDCH